MSFNCHRELAERLGVAVRHRRAVGSIFFAFFYSTTGWKEAKGKKGYVLPIPNAGTATAPLAPLQETWGGEQLK